MTETLTRDWAELAHPVRQDAPPKGSPAWKDNAYLSFWDPEHRLNGVVHVSTSPNAEGRRARASFAIDGRASEVAEELEPGTFQSESIEFDLGGRIEVHTDDIDASLELARRGAYCDYSAGGIVPELVEGEPLQHFQAAAVVTGEVTVRGESTEADGVGLRDRTWGYRDESTGFGEYIGLLADVAGEFLTVMKFASPDGKVVRAEGFMLGDGEARPLSDITAITRDASGLFAAATVVGAGGEEVEYRTVGRTGGFWVPMGWERQGPAMSAYDEFLHLRTSDGREANGMVEQGIVRHLA